MNISIFDVIGPVMIGPSSSHTAGAARLARIGRLIVGGAFSHVSFGLHGSFAKTYQGHGTDRALVAGVLDIKEDDERLSDAFEIAKGRGITYDFHEVDLEGMHENSVEMQFSMDDGKINTIVGSSIGGGRIVIRKINEFDMEFSAGLSTLVIRQNDIKGIVSEVSKVLAQNDINIGVMRLSRKAKGREACCIIEMDNVVSDEVVEQIRKIPGILNVQAINIDTAEERTDGI